MIEVTLHKQGTQGVNYDDTYDEFLNDFVSAGFPYMETDDQIIIFDEVDGADTRIYVLNGDNIQYDFPTHTVSGSLDSVIMGTLGGAWNSDGSFDLDGQDHITGYNKIVEYSNLDVSNPAGVRGDFHEIVAELMYLGGSEARGAETFEDAIESGGQDVTGSSKNDVFTGTRFNDDINGASGNDSLSGENGNDSIIGGAGNDTLNGGSGFDTLRGGNQNDELYGNRQADTLYGDGGNDSLYGGQGNDLFYGGAGQDKLFGQDGRDTLYGGDGNDTLNGGDDLDVLNGGAGRDKLTGGNGRDSFVFSSASAANNDQILDFDVGGNETIDLKAIDAKTNVSGNQAFSFIGSDNFSGTAGELRITETSTNTMIRGDIDGDGSSDFVIVVSNYFGITESDFIL